MATLPLWQDDTMSLELISVDTSDLSTLDQMARLNGRNVPELGPADLAKITDLVSRAWWSLAVLDEGGSLAGFAIVFEPGAQYTSVNYRYFDERYRDFVYLDRVAVDGAWRRRGVATMIYDAVADRGRDRGWFALEVNVAPRNEVSLAFHRRYGFTEIARQNTGSYPGRPDEEIIVSLQVARLG